ncbi:MAG: retroviral-like aspartic protease family protein [Chitinophagaceae bacterium]
MNSLYRTLCLGLAVATAVAAGNNEDQHPPGSFFTFRSFFPKIATEYNLSRGIYSDPVVTSETPSCIIPFSRAGNLIVIRAKVDTTEGNFILDTGAPKLILNATYFRNYLTSAVNTESGGITGSVAASTVTIPGLSFGPIKYYGVETDLVNLGHIENSKGIKILGLLGMQLFRKFEMIIDYEKNVIHLHLVGKKEAATYKNEMLSDTSAYHTIRIRVRENKLLSFGEMAGKKLTFLIDTGAESNVLDSRLSEKIFKNVNITSRVLLAGSGNTKVEALYGDMKNMKLGTLQIESVPVLVTNLEKMCYAFEQCLDGMLGFDFLSLHKIGFNFVTGKMYIWK